MSGELTRNRLLICTGGYFLFFLGTVFLSPFIGAERLHFQQIWMSTSSIDQEIFLYQRLPRICLAAFAGGTLAVAGACLQVIFRNPLTEPYTLGITGGASVGAVLAISIPNLMISWGPFSTVQLCSLAGALVVLYIIFSIARKPEGIAPNTLLLAGITISILSAGIILLIRYIANPKYLVSMDRWFMGGVDILGYSDLSTLFPILLPGLWLLFTCMVELNHLSLGDEMALGHGVDVYSVQKRIFAGCGIATAAVVSLAGPIGFVGLIIPHIVRNVSGYDHRIILPASFFAGGGFLVLCDTISRTILSPMEMPVGIITALIGAPVFISILLKIK